MRILLVTALHYPAPPLDWVVRSAPSFDLVVVAAHSLDIRSIVSIATQAIMNLRYLEMLQAAGAWS